VTFGTLATRAAALASGLLAQGLGHGDRVAVMLRNSPDALAVIWGLAMAGLVWVPVNTGQRGPGLRYQLDHSAPARIIAEADLWPEVTACGAALPAAPILRAGTGPCPLAAVLNRPGATPPAPPDPGATMAIMYTSGTTGAPKGVPVTHRMMRHAARGVIRLTDPHPGDVFYLWEPLYHIGGAQILALPALAGLRIAMAERFSASRFWPEVAASGATHIHYLGGILQILLKQPPCPEERANRLRMAWGGGCPAEVFAAVRARYGFALHECYGMTEMSSLTTVSDGTTGGVVGRPLPWFTVTIRDTDGETLPPGTRGEIVVQTSDPTTFFTGYLDAPEATARTLKDGRLHTGDIGSLGPDGSLWLDQLPLSWSSGNLWVVHAGADPARAMPDQTARVLLWGHPEFDSAPRGDDAWVAHGHVERDTPEIHDGRIGVDTAAWATGRLTAVAIKPDGSHAFLQT
jgi:crotonobetaine/carnitine-CoA ligase